MDPNDPARLRYNDPTGSGQEQQAGGQYSNPVTPQRLSQPTYGPQRQLAPSQEVARAGSDLPQIYGFGQGLQYGGPQQYGQVYVGQDPARPQQQQFAQYGSDLAYGMQQAQNQPASDPPYGQLQQYRPRDSATIETMSGQFAEQQAAAQYYPGAQPGPSTARQTGFGPSQLVSHYQPATYVASGPPAAPSYPGAIIDPMHQTAYEAFGQQHALLRAPQLQQQTHQGQVEQGYARYQNNIRSIFTLVRNRSLREIAQPLLDASRYLLGSVEALGLTRDEEGQHDNRIALWDEYNRAWLTTMQCQLDMTQELFSGRSLQPSQSTLDHNTLERLATELLRLCDDIEKHGLVDYQMGVAEDEIVDVILRCLSQLESSSGDAADTEAMEH